MKSRYTLAVDGPRVALIRRQRNQFFVEHLRTIEPHVKPLDILRPILHRKGALLVSGLAAQEVILRQLHLNLKTRREILAALPFQMEEHLPFTPEEAVAIPTITLGKTGSRIDLMATRRQMLDRHLETLRERAFAPDVVSAEPIAPFRFAQFLYPQQASLLIYEPKKQILAAMEDHALVAFQIVPERDLKRALAYFQKKFPAIEQILTIGTCKEEMPLQRLRIENEEWIPYATAIGLALDAARQDTHSRQFLSGPLQAKRAVLKQKKATLIYFGLSALFCATTLLLSRHHLSTDRAAFLCSLNLPQSASLSEVASSLHTSIKRREKTPILDTDLPRVHEILLWLSTHPDLQGGITINHLHYQITKCPRLGTPLKASQGHIDIDFTAEFPRLARAFHDALKSDSSVVDRRHEVQFSSEHGLYRVSFHMKEKRR